MMIKKLPSIKKQKALSKELVLRPQEPDNRQLAAIAPSGSCPPRTFADALNLLHSPSQAPIQILRLPEVMKRVGICRALIYQRIADGSFPKQISLGARAVGWLEHEINAWLAVRMQGRHVPQIESSKHLPSAKLLSSGESEGVNF